MLPDKDATETRTDTDDGAAKKDAKPSVREFVAKDREGKRDAAEGAPAADAKSDEGAAAGEGEGDEKKPYTWEELTRELESKDISELDQSRIPTALKKKIDSYTTAEGRKQKKLNDQLAALEAKQRELDEALAAAKAGKHGKPTESESEGEEDSLLTKEELLAIYKSKAGKELFAELLQEMGFNRIDAKEAADTRLFRDAISGAKAEDERLQDDAFFDDVLEHIRNDERLSATTRKDNVTGAELRNVFLTASNAVDRVRAAKERDALKAEREKLDKEKKEAKNRDKPGSKAAGSRPSSGNSGERPTVRDFVKQQRLGRI